MCAFTHVNGLFVFAYLSTSGFPHSLEQSPRPQASKRPNSPIHWKNPPANQPLSGQKPPLTGTITPLTRLPADKFPQSLEENARKSTSQRADSSTDWRKTDKTIPSKCPDSSSEWKKQPADGIHSYCTRIFAGAAIVEHVIHGMRTVFAEFKARWLARQFYVGTPRRRRT